MAEHKHGSMNIDAQEKAFEGFVKWSIRVATFSIGLLIFMAIFTT